MDLCSDAHRRNETMSPTRAHGFTLIEVLIAIAILATAAIALGVGYVNVLNGYEIAKQATVSEPEIQFARSQLMSQPDVELARQGGDFESHDGRRVRWTATIEPTQLADLFTVTFECEIVSAGAVNGHRVQQVFRALRPTWSAETDRATLRAASRDRITKILEGVNK